MGGALLNRFRVTLRVTEAVSTPMAHRERIEAKPPKCRARASNSLAPPGLDCRTAEGRRLVDMARTLAREVAPDGNLSDAQAEAVRRWAALALVAERARARALGRRKTDLVALSRIESTADRARRAALALRAEKSSGPTLASYLASKSNPGPSPGQGGAV